MPLRHSPDKLEESCRICRRSLRDQGEVLRTACQHCFHRACLLDWLQNNSSCPQCRTQCRSNELVKLNKPSANINTRSQTRVNPNNIDQPSTSAAAAASNRLSNPPPPTGSIDRTSETSATVRNSSDSSEQNSEESGNTEEARIRNLVSAVVSARQANLLQDLEKHISTMFEQKFESSLNVLMSRLTTNQLPSQNQPVQPIPSPNQNVSHQDWPRQMPNDLISETENTNHVPRSSTPSTLLTNSNKISQIITNWDIRFDGSAKLSVESFIYRIESQVIDTLGGNFNILCDNAQCLFLGDAKDWYWRYRRSVDKVTWPSLSEALKINFSTFRSDAEIIDSMKSRKQGPSESFDSFKNAVLKISESLSIPISDAELLRILETGLRPRIRQQLLHIDITSLAQLRKLCLKGEAFFQELSKSNFSNSSQTSRTFPKKQINEIEEFCVDPLNDQDEEKALVDAIEKPKSVTKFVCWNCKEVGHRYQDCLAERTIFCYGCGAANTYKPQCPKCSGNGPRSGGHQDTLR